MPVSLAARFFELKWLKAWRAEMIESKRHEIHAPADAEQDSITSCDVAQRLEMIDHPAAEGWEKDAAG